MAEVGECPTIDHPPYEMRLTRLTEKALMPHPRHFKRDRVSEDISDERTGTNGFKPYDTLRRR